MADTFIELCTTCAKVCGLFSRLYFSDADWLGRQTSIRWRISLTLHRAPTGQEAKPHLILFHAQHWWYIPKPSVNNTGF